jgi:RNA polymerase sigma-70 factor (ECF subfamily)
VAQEAYLEIWRHAARFDEKRGSAIAWILTIVHRQAVDRVRSAEARRTREETYRQQELPNRHRSQDPTPDVVHASIEARRVRKALAQLTPVQRESLELAFFGGYSYSEVADLVGVPLGTVKSRIRGGLLQLRELM